MSLLSQYLRDIILGVNDGLVSMFLIVFGMFGGGALARSILLAGITGAIAGAISMGLGEYIATKSQLEIMVSDVSRERYLFHFIFLHPSPRSIHRFNLFFIFYDLHSAFACRRNLVHHRPKVIEELREKVAEMGFVGDLLDRIVEDVQSDDERLIKFLYRTFDLRVEFKMFFCPALFFLACCTEMPFQLVPLSQPPKKTTKTIATR